MVSSPQQSTLPLAVNAQANPTPTETLIMLEVANDYGPPPGQSHSAFTPDPPQSHVFRSQKMLPQFTGTQYVPESGGAARAQSQYPPLVLGVEHTHPAAQAPPAHSACGCGNGWPFVVQILPSAVGGATASATTSPRR